MTVNVIALPGGVNPAALRYAPLRAAVGSGVRLHLKDLEVYADDEPPPGYSIAMEVDALGRFADSLGLERFHLLGYSGGGRVSLAFAGAHPDRLLSLALFEPASVPGPLSDEEALLVARLREGLKGLEGAAFIRAFMTLQVRAGVELAPPAGPPPAWMRTRPAGLAAMMGAFAAHPFDRDSLRRLTAPVFVGHGELSGPQEEVRAGVLARLLPDIRIRRFPGIHHFVTPEEVYGAGHVRELSALWARVEAGAPV
jgi:pimeloyl-ACP methyl ester carboxylesterase